MVVSATESHPTFYSFERSDILAYMDIFGRPWALPFKYEKEHEIKML